MIRWLEGTLPRAGGGRAVHYAADTPIGRVTVKGVYHRNRGLIAWRGKLADGLEIEQSTAQACMRQIEAIVQLRLDRIKQRDPACPD